MKHPECGNCRYYAYSRSTCMRFPPTGRPSAFPLVTPHDWCGEFEVNPTHKLFNDPPQSLEMPIVLQAKRKPGRPRKIQQPENIASQIEQGIE